MKNKPLYHPAPGKRFRLPRKRKKAMRKAGYRMHFFYSLMRNDVLADLFILVLGMQSAVTDAVNRVLKGQDAVTFPYTFQSAGALEEQLNVLK